MTYYNQPLAEFVSDVRFCAAQNNAPPALIDKLDELLDCNLEGSDAISEKAYNEGYEEAEKNCQSEIDALRDENDKLAERIAQLEDELDAAMREDER